MFKRVLTPSDHYTPNVRPMSCHRRLLKISLKVLLKVFALKTVPTSE